MNALCKMLVAPFVALALLLLALGAIAAGVDAADARREFHAQLNRFFNLNKG